MIAQLVEMQCLVAYIIKRDRSEMLNDSQYLRYLLQGRGRDGIKVGQMWLINRGSLEAYVRNGQTVRDRRLGPRPLVDDAGE